MNSQEIELAVLRKVLTEQVQIRIQGEVEAVLAQERCRLLQQELDVARAPKKRKKPEPLKAVA